MTQKKKKKEIRIRVCDECRPKISEIFDQLTEERNELIDKLEELKKALEERDAYIKELEAEKAAVKDLAQDTGVIVSKHKEYAYVAFRDFPLPKKLYYRFMDKKEIKRLRKGDMVFVRTIMMPEQGPVQVIVGKCRDLKYPLRMAKVVAVGKDYIDLRVGPHQIIRKDYDPKKQKCEVGWEAELLPGNEIFALHEAVSKWELAKTERPRVTYADVGGLWRAKQEIREMVELPLLYPELFTRLGIDPPKGILLQGPPGCGKTLLARAVAGETRARFYHIAGPEIMSKWVGESEERLREIFEEAKKNTPAIIFIDEIDAIAPKREEVTGEEAGRRVVSQLLALMDGLEPRGQLVVIAATNKPEILDEALRRPGRFDREVYIPVPDRAARREILEIHTRKKGMPLADDVDLDVYADKTHGYSGADLAALARESAMRAVRRVTPDLLEKELYREDISQLDVRVTAEDFEQTLKEIKPSALREYFVEIPKVTDADVGGLKDIKRELRRTIIWPLKYPHTFDESELSSAILLYGPRGCGKTLLAKWIATQSGYNVLAIRGPELVSKYVGETPRHIRRYFKMARQAAPCILIIDEIESIAPRRIAGTEDPGRNRMVTQLLTELSGLEGRKNVYVIGTTNRPDLIDEAFLRPGRFGKLIEVPPPDLEGREEIFKIHTQIMQVAEDVDYRELAELTDGYSGADIEEICKMAKALARQDLIYSLEGDPARIGEAVKGWKVGMAYFRAAIEKIPPSLGRKEEGGEISHLM